MKRFKKLLPIVAIVVLIATMLVPATVMAAPLTGCRVTLSNHTPGAAGVEYKIEFFTATELPACTPPSNYTQINLDFFSIYTSLPTPSDSPVNYILAVGSAGPGYQDGGGAPTDNGTYTVTRDDVNNTVNIKYCHTEPISPFTAFVVAIEGVTNDDTIGSYGITIATRSSANPDADLDTGQTGYVLRTPQELVCQVMGELISVGVEPGYVDYGVLATGNITNTALRNPANNPNGMATPQTQQIRNTGTVNEDFKIRSSDAITVNPEGTDWTLVETIPPGLTQFTHAYNVGTSAYTVGPIFFTKWTTAGVSETVAEDVAPGPPGSSWTIRYLELQLGMPTATTDYAPHTITVTVLAEMST